MILALQLLGSRQTNRFVFITFVTCVETLIEIIVIIVNSFIFSYFTFLYRSYPPRVNLLYKKTWRKKVNKNLKSFSSSKAEVSNTRPTYSICAAQEYIIKGACRGTRTVFQPGFSEVFDGLCEMFPHFYFQRLQVVKFPTKGLAHPVRRFCYIIIFGSKITTLGKG